MTAQEKKRQKEVMLFWLDSARRDRETASSLLASQHYDWSLFVFHLAIEKILKALIIQKEITPPFTHKLLQLVEIAELNITEEQTDWLTEITEFNIEARYPDAKQEFYTKATADFAQTWHDRCESLFIWLEQHL
jgi:HEPN domain-containing protein